VGEATTITPSLSDSTGGLSDSDSSSIMGGGID
jgi:hypothetical protein